MLTIILILITHFSFANVKIEDIDIGNQNEPVLLFLTNGKVKRLDKRTAFKKKEVLQFLKNGKQKKAFFFKEDHYYKSILENYDQVENLFHLARREYKEESQCYHRAHVWAYEWRKMGVYSTKTWLFFSKKYIREHNFQWWFHVAPSVHVKTQDGIKERILDVKYGKSPQKLKDWTNIFIRDGSDCPIVEKYTDQADFPESNSCYIIKSSMYYFQPYELELHEINNISKTHWVKEEVQISYKDGFDILL
jgi:hypothetical protein